MLQFSRKGYNEMCFVETEAIQAQTTKRTPILLLMLTGDWKKPHQTLLSFEGPGATP